MPSILSAVQGHCPERDGLHLAVSTCPHARDNHERRAGGLEHPPENVGGEGTRVQGGDEEMEEVDR